MICGGFYITQTNKNLKLPPFKITFDFVIFDLNVTYGMFMVRFMSRKLGPLTIQILRGRWMLLLHRLWSNTGLRWRPTADLSQQEIAQKLWIQHAIALVFLSWVLPYHTGLKKLNVNKRLSMFCRLTLKNWNTDMSRPEDSCLQKAGCVKLLVFYTGKQPQSQ